MNPKVTTLDLGDWRMHVEEGGDGSPAVFVHGGFPSLLTEIRNEEYRDGTWTWEAELAQSHRFVWYDRRGCYRSSAPEHGYELETQAGDIGRLLDHLGLETAHVIGSSAGGPISIVFAATNPPPRPLADTRGHGAAAVPRR